MHFGFFQCIQQPQCTQDSPLNGIIIESNLLNTLQRTANTLYWEMKYLLIRGVDTLTTAIFDRRLFSPDVIILFENLDTSGESFLDISEGMFLGIPRMFMVTGVTTQ